MKDSFLVKAIALLVFVFLLIAALYFARTFLIPVAFSALISMLLLPLCRKMEKWRIGRIPSIIFCIFLVVVLVSGIILISYTQVINFVNDLDIVQEKLLTKLSIVQKYIQGKTGVSSADQMVWLKERYSSLLESGTSALKGIVMGFTEGFVTLGLIVIYTFFFLLYRDRFKIFILKLFPEKHHIKVEVVINRTKDLILHYLSGLLIALTILGTMNSIGLLALGIRQAIFLGYLAGFLNIIPYVGTMIGSLLPVLVALLFKDSIWYAIGVSAIFAFNQFIDNNITTPNVVGSHVQVNPLATIMAVITGGIVWGIPGMILFIPFLGVIKIICDNVEKLQPIGYLLGEEPSQKESPQMLKKFAEIIKRKNPK